MHNLAVLYAEGIDGKPDYKVAAQWFRKAVELRRHRQPVQSRDPLRPRHRHRPNLAESYKWFALAAAKGDQDAAKKRDEVAARLDQKTLAAAKLAAQTFAPEPRARRGDQPQGAAGRLGPARAAAAAAPSRKSGTTRHTPRA